MQRILLPAGVAVVATGLLTAGLSGTSRAFGDISQDSMARDTADAVSVASFWLASNGAALRSATPYTWNAGQIRKVVSKGGHDPDGKPGTTAPISDSRPAAIAAQNVNLPKTVGKVFFVDGSGRFRWCSGTSIQSNYRNLVSTAGHCVYDTAADRAVMDKWVFVPGYYQGRAPWGIYVGEQAFTHYDFEAYEDHDRDYAFVTVYNGIHLNAAKQVNRRDYQGFTGPKRAWGGRYYLLLSKDAGRLGDNVGGQGFAWNQPAGRTVRAFGYPAARHPDGDRPYGGVTPKQCHGRTTAKALGASWLKIEDHLGLKCAVTPGFDGGPWLLNYDNSKRLGYVNGTTSTFADQDGNDRVDYITSPYFDGETEAVYDAAKNVWTDKIVGPDGELYR
ncbi:trypsin-like serine peptidase [Nonomuraea jiangxiensis]|uniref:V8-like Glu-specific endopeptidase n=1 Tax=Nonomuraea jiangxiensis TaxID=633440 RepID=A0A1G9KAQ4_9ACTN|nr:hypothetical protein [Nonomuraea jiangxiensis]SDL46514.1 hypothetical protein SAMN05421869_12652 [Nonomuraea jiangxiensis]